MFDNATYKGFYKLSRAQRLELLEQNGVISAADKSLLQCSTSPQVQDVADKMIENTLGCFPLPLGLATGLVINGKPRLIPMATEETSVIAAVSSAASWLRQHNASIITSQQGWGIIGQVHFVAEAAFDKVTSYVLQHKQKLLDFLNCEVAPSMHKRGGGFFDIRLKRLAGGVLAVNIYFNPSESMGANLVTQGAEALKSLICTELGVSGLMAIVSNSCDAKKTVATVKVCGVEEGLLAKIVLASKVASADPWRASTHNKGILNGIDALAIATGNDWRAIESGLNSFAAGRPLATWSKEEGALVGTIAGPLPVAMVGGATSHPMAKVCKKILQASSAHELAGVMMAVGLVQNLAALKALVTKGLAAGHMKLHIENIILDCGASLAEHAALRQQLTEHLCVTGRVTFSDAASLLRTMRHEPKS